MVEREFLNNNNYQNHSSRSTFYPHSLLLKKTFQLIHSSIFMTYFISKFWHPKLIPIKYFSSISVFTSKTKLYK